MNPDMPPDRVRRIRFKLGRISQSKLAQLLGMKSDRNIREWEKDKVDVPGPSALALRYLAQGTPDTLEALDLPRYVTSTVNDQTLVIRLERPRCIMRDGEIVMWIDKPDGFDIEEIKAEARLAARD